MDIIFYDKIFEHTDYLIKGTQTLIHGQRADINHPYIIEPRLCVRSPDYSDQITNIWEVTDALVEHLDNFGIEHVRGISSLNTHHCTYPVVYLTEDTYNFVRLTSNAYNNEHVVKKDHYFFVNAYKRNFR